MLLRAARREPLVVSFPKSGRTWLRVMLDRLGIEAEYTHFGAGVARGLTAAELAPRPWWCARRPVLLLVRDPRDTAISGFYQASRRRRTYSGDLSSFLRDPRFGIEKVIAWNAAWMSLACRLENTAVVEYEALHRDGAACLAAVARHFGREPTPDQLAAAWRAGAFASMRAREASGQVERRYRRVLEPADRCDPDSFKVRNGVAGGYLRTLGEGDLAYCAAALSRHAYAVELAEALIARGLPAR